MNDSRIDDLIARMTLEEKVSLCSGRDFWNTKAVERLGIHSIRMSDGPHGLRKQPSADEASLQGSLPSTCFPTAVGLAASWNCALLEELGKALGKEAQAGDVGVLLGPGVNIKRSPLCGRNFEYLSEDPCLAGELAASCIRGIQSQGVGASLKHFAANNQERLRMTIDARIDMRTLREIYLPAFETAVKEGRPWTVMTAYNSLNGQHCTENAWLLGEVLREEWGFDGAVVTDWGAAADRVAGIKAGNDLEMPSSEGRADRQLIAAVKSGALEERDLDRAVANILRLVFRVEKNRRTVSLDSGTQHGLARRIAGECMVLLKNEGHLLPLEPKGRIAIIGALAKTPRYQGTGSSRINPTRLDSAWEAAGLFTGDRAILTYSEGYDLARDEPVPSLRAEAIAAAEAADVSIVFVGLTEQYESEAYDRKHLRLPPSHVDLLEAVAARQKKIVVVLSNGSPVEMPWIDQVPAVLESYLGGQAGGAATIDIVFGAVNPSGKLAETFPRRAQDNPSYLNFPGGKGRVEYREGLFVGYRYYDSVDIEPLFPFGHGLSYTSFEYGQLELTPRRLRAGESLSVSLNVRNIGSVRGQEVVQVYLRDEEATVVRPKKELKGFAKVDLAPGESRRVAVNLGGRAFAFWDETIDDWNIESGDFEVLVGGSSREIRLSGKVRVDQPHPPKAAYTMNSLVEDLVDHPAVGWAIRRVRQAAMTALSGPNADSHYSMMNASIVSELPLRNLLMFTPHQFPEEAPDLILDVLNGKSSPEALVSLIPGSPHSS